MSPRLERALSEALEEELARELAPALEPIMSRIKKLVPAVIKSCRLKLMRTSPSSDDETVFTPSAGSSGVGSSDSEPGSSKKQAKDRSSPTTSRCPGSSFDAVSTPEELSSKVKGKRPQRSAPSTSDISAEGRQEVPPLGSSTDLRMLYSDAPSDMLDFHRGNIDHPCYIGDGGWLHKNLRGFSSDGTPPDAEGSSNVSANTLGIPPGPYHYVEDLAQQSNTYLPGFQLSTLPLPRAAWDSGSGAHGQPGGDHLGGIIPREQEPPPAWDPMENFDFSHSSNS